MVPVLRSLKDPRHHPSGAEGDALLPAEKGVGDERHEDSEWRRGAGLRGSGRGGLHRETCRASCWVKPPRGQRGGNENGRSWLERQEANPWKGRVQRQG